MGTSTGETEPGVTPAVADCPLSEQAQTRNLILVGVNTSLSYLASPILYVAVVHAALIKEMSDSATVANLPSTAYLAMASLPLFVAWYVPQVALLKHILVSCY